jgi:peptidyl-prolyl cis-trans isomerase SurA
MKQFFTLFGLLFLCVTPLHAAELLDKIVAVVGDEVITQSELERNLAPVFEEYKSRFQGAAFIEQMTKARASILSQMIEDKIVLQDAKKKKVRVSDEEIERKIVGIKKRFKTPEDFQRYLDSQGVTLTKLKERYRDMIAMQKLQHLEVRSKVVISPTEVQKYYEGHLDEFTSPEAFHIRAITIRKKRDLTGEGRDAKLARQKLEGLHDRIAKGASFEEIAKQNSEDTYAAEGGDMGFMSKGQFIPQLEDEIFKLEPGAMTSVLESDIGFHIFKLEGHQMKRTKTFDEAKEYIEGMLYTKRSQERFQEWISRLKQETYIAIQ